MLKRFATVLWWIGLASLLMAIVPVTLNFLRSLDCPQVIAAKEKAAAAAQRWEKDYPNWPDRLNAQIASRQQPAGANAMDKALAQLADTNWAASADVDTRAAQCTRGAELGFEVVWGMLTTMLWALAFVLGGRFWLPPKVSATF